MPRLFALLCCLLLTLPAHAGTYLQRLLDKPVPGGVAVVPVPGDQAPRVSYQGKPVLVVKDGNGWVAIVGIPLGTAAGRQQLAVAGAAPLAFNVGSRHYAEQHITLKNQHQVTPNPEDLKRFERELAAQQATYRLFSPNQPSNLLLDKPVNGPLSSPFGLRRFFNGQQRNPHSGLDFAVPAGTPVKSPAAGKVVLVGDYFFNGKTVFVDHGQGFISMFCHLSRIDVQVGQQVPRGGVIGRVGSTGRATGPHLHWNVSLNDVRVDPSIFIGAFKP